MVIANKTKKRNAIIKRGFFKYFVLLITFFSGTYISFAQDSNTFIGVGGFIGSMNNESVSSSDPSSFSELYENTYGFNCRIGTINKDRTLYFEYHSVSLNAFNLYDISLGCDLFIAELINDVRSYVGAYAGYVKITPDENIDNLKEKDSKKSGFCSGLRGGFLLPLIDHIEIDISCKYTVFKLKMNFSSDYIDDYSEKYNELYGFNIGLNFYW